MKKKPLFVFTLSHRMGIGLIEMGWVFDSNKNLIEETKYYDLKKDCNGVHIYPSQNQNFKTIKQ